MSTVIRGLMKITKSSGIVWECARCLDRLTLNLVIGFPCLGLLGLRSQLEKEALPGTSRAAFGTFGLAHVTP